MPCYFYIILLQVFTAVNILLHSYVDMCECTNHIRSHGHPKQMLLCCSYIIDHAYVYVCIKLSIAHFVYTQQ